MQREFFLLIKCNIVYPKQKEKLTTYKEADFTPNDELVVAARHTYLCIWNAATGNPLRLLHSSLSPVTKLFTSPAVNKAITLLEDNSIQVCARCQGNGCFVNGKCFPTSKIIVGI